ncbi:hypothetical protein Nepgr_000178 [Nepenthes gracilis]|uniref:Uncharacterized protein n=1 Tax=Nepenthes gracilis TaxID=150966 RepID=A0AAD3RW23_NEPGR|nr:hypothetical protein Nepgr_000178 [Nepenthes gracilis]
MQRVLRFLSLNSRQSPTADLGLNLELQWFLSEKGLGHLCGEIPIWVRQIIPPDLRLENNRDLLECPFSMLSKASGCFFA